MNIETLLSKYKEDHLTLSRRDRRLIKELSTITDFFGLWSIRKFTISGSRDEQQLEDRMVELLPEVLPTINFSGLKDLWDLVSSGSKLRPLIEDRMTEMLSSVTKDDPPTWFIDLLENRCNCPIPAVLDEVVTKLLQ